MISLLLAAVIFMSLTVSCGSDGERVTNVFRSDEIALPEGFRVKWLRRLADGFALISEYDYENDARVLRMDSDFSVTDRSETIPCSEAAFLPDGSTAYSENGGVRISGARELFVEDYFLTETSESGGTVSAKLADFDGNILAVGQFNALVTDSELKKIGDIPMSGSLESYDLSPDGKFMLMTRDKLTGKGEYGFVDVKTGRFSEKYSVPAELSIYGISAFAGAGGKIYLRCATGVYSCLDGKYEYLCDFMNSDVMPSKLGDMCFLDDERFLAVYDGGLFLMTRVPDSEVEPRELIRAAGINIPDYLNEKAVDFNRSNDRYRVVLKDYDVFSGASAEQMRNDIISGKVPDIMIFSPTPGSEQYHDEYIRQGMFADLWEFIDMDGYPDRSDLLSGVVKLGERGGKLYELVTWACVECFQTTDADVPEDGWTLREFLDWGKSLEDRSVINANYVSRTDLLWYMLSCSMDVFVDEENGTCEFDTPLFREAMEFAKDCTMKSSNSALSYTIFDGAQIWFYKKNSAVKKPGTRLVGFPSESGNGMLISGTGFSISAKSDVREAAWEFVASLLPELGRSDSGEFAVTRQSVKSAVEYVREAGYVYWYGDDGTEKQVKFTDYREDTFDTSKGRAVILDETDEEYLIGLLDGAGKSVSKDSKMWSIISEEADVYFAGAKTLDETVEIIQSRISTYVSERS